MKAARSSEILVSYITIWRHNPEDQDMNFHRLAYPRSRILMLSSQFLLILSRCHKDSRPYVPFPPYPVYEGVSRSFRTRSITKSTTNTSSEATQKGYGDKIHWSDSQNSDTTAPSGRELYNLQFSFQAASPETFGYSLVYAQSIVAS
jgi:hypothetical protein